MLIRERHDQKSVKVFKIFQVRVIKPYLFL